MMTIAARRGKMRRGRNKYSAKKAVVAGISFDSQAEARRYKMLRMMEIAGKVSDLQLQVRIPLLGRDGPLKSAKGRSLVYVCDFCYVQNGEQIYEDLKGFQTAEFKLKRSILAAMGINLRLTRAS